MSSITITDPAALTAAIAFAEANGCLDELARGLLRLLQTASVGMTRDSHRIGEIGKDFAPHSFTFAIWDGAQTRPNMVLAGGLIYAGPSAPGDGSFPSLSVDLGYVTGQRAKHSWNLHT
jgi:hypothetical protein